MDGPGPFVVIVLLLVLLVLVGVVLPVVGPAPLVSSKLIESHEGSHGGTL